MEKEAAIVEVPLVPLKRNGTNGTKGYRYSALSEKRYLETVPVKALGRNGLRYVVPLVPLFFLNIYIGV